VGRYLARRIMLGVVTIWIVTLMLFIGLRVIVPIFYADVVDIIVGEYGKSDVALQEQLRDEYGLSGSLFTQYIDWIRDLLSGNLGESLFNGRSIGLEMKARLPVSVELGLIGLGASVLLAIPLGTVSALMQDRWPDYVIRTYAVGSSAVPSFWLAIMIITLGSIWWRWAPPIDFAYLHEDPVKHIKIMLLPGLLIGLTPSGALVRLMRAQMLEVLRQDYIRTARSKGLSERTVLMRHATRNAMIPIVTIIGLSLPGLIAGTALFELIFVLPGMGQYLISSISNLDYPVVQGTNIVFALLIVASNLLVDISYTWIDPRIRYQ
jgi:peptide/nickel transport system permease protein